MSERLSAGLLCIAVLGAVGCSQPPPRPSAPQAPATPPAQIAPWGLDLAARDTSVKPGDDFYGYADGHWLDTHQIPPDRTRWGSFDELGERSHDQVRSIVEALPDGAPAASNEQKVGDYYRSYLDTEAIERLGLTPARPGLDAIGDARTHKQLARLMGRADLALKAPLRVGINLDQKDPDRYAVTITQSGLGLPDRDYYLKGDTVYANLRTQYLAHIMRLLALAGDHDAAREAHAVLEIETRIAKLHWPAAKRRERDLTWNPRTLAELDQLAPRFSWNLLLSSEGVDAQAQFVVRELNAVQDLAQLFLKIPVDDWRAYFRYHYLADHAEVLPKAF
ncbi:MAG: M13 family peptidase, partial [Gammaproteobacteria bacterium]